MYCIALSQLVLAAVRAGVNEVLPLLSSAELRVDVDQPAHPLPREGSSSEYSSSSSSPMGIQTREESSDSAEENERRKQTQPGRGLVWSCSVL